MNEPLAICPQCLKEVRFVRDAKSARCPACGFVYQFAGPVREPAAESDFQVALKALGIMVLVVFGAAVLGVGVAFAGCVLR